MKKPEILTKEEVFFDYYFSKMIEEQKKTNELLKQLLGEGGKEHVIGSRTRKSV
jgi:hypothetical protein